MDSWLVSLMLFSPFVLPEFTIRPNPLVSMMEFALAAVWESRSIAPREVSCTPSPIMTAVSYQLCVGWAQLSTRISASLLRFRLAFA